MRGETVLPACPEAGRRDGERWALLRAGAANPAGVAQGLWAGRPRGTRSGKSHPSKDFPATRPVGGDRPFVLLSRPPSLLKVLYRRKSAFGCQGSARARTFCMADGDPPKAGVDGVGGDGAPAAFWAATAVREAMLCRQRHRPGDGGAQASERGCGSRSRTGSGAPASHTRAPRWRRARADGDDTTAGTCEAADDPPTIAREPRTLTRTGPGSRRRP